MLGTLHKIGEVHFRFLGTNGLRVKAKNERFTVLRASNVKHFDVVIWQTTSNWLHRKALVPHVQHGYFFLIQPIKSMIWDIVAAIAVIISQTPY